MLHRPSPARRRVVLVCVVLIASSALAHAQSAPSQSGSRRAVWTAVGAGAGFGLGLFVGLGAFDDAVNSDRKIWTTAVVAGAAGGVVGYVASRDKPRPSPRADLSKSNWLPRVRLRDPREPSRPYLRLFAPGPIAGTSEAGESSIDESRRRRWSVNALFNR